MDLAEVRSRIDEIDSKLMELLKDRKECSKQVAEAKLNTSDCIFKPSREKEICEKFMQAGIEEGIPVIKAVMRKSRQLQYGIYIDNQKEEKTLIERMDEDNRDALKHGGELLLLLESDESGEHGLTKKDIMMIVAESELEIKNIRIDRKEIEVEVLVEDNDESRRKAYILGYMLYMETLH